MAFLLPALAPLIPSAIEYISNIFGGDDEEDEDEYYYEGEDYDDY